ncbi:MAG: FtsW/RodA/SpoVE family cell cycle protein [Chloroflexi bacterium]|nr:FtsW/RodA/SpoVE family cell cycle protein [Chloroflexota bacterium]
MRPRLRPTELGLLLLATWNGIALLAVLALASPKSLAVPVRNGVWIDGLASAVGAGLVLAVLLLGCHIATSVLAPRGDQALLPLAGLLTFVGLFVISRVAPEQSARQTAWAALGAVAFVVTLAWPELGSLLRRYRYTWVTLGLGTLLLTFALGVDPNGSGARLWLGFGGVYFQPSEVLKVLVVVYLASYLAEKRELLAFGEYRLGRLVLPPLPYLVPLAVIVGFSLLLLLIQRDLGATFLFFGVSLALLYCASGRTIYLLGGAGLFLIGTFVAYRLFSVAQRRIDIWLNPWSDPQGATYQTIQGLLALASGGVLGVGPGWGSPHLIPAGHTDFPFAVVGEELGLMGTLAVAVIYLLLVGQGFRVALRLSGTFETLLAAGLSTVVGLQALIILAGNLALVPLTGITLPFVSYGGSSLVTNFLILGLLVRLSHEADDE